MNAKYKLKNGDMRDAKMCRNIKAILLEQHGIVTFANVPS